MYGTQNMDTWNTNIWKTSCNLKVKRLETQNEKQMEVLRLKVINCEFSLPATNSNPVVTSLDQNNQIQQPKF